MKLRRPGHHTMQQKNGLLYHAATILLKVANSGLGRINKCRALTSLSRLRFAAKLTLIQ